MGISFLYLAGNVASNRLDSFFGNVRIFQQHGDGMMAQIVHTEALQISRGDHAQPSSLERGSDGVWGQTGNGGSGKGTGSDSGSPHPVALPELWLRSRL